MHAALLTLIRNNQQLRAGYTAGTPKIIRGIVGLNDRGNDMDILLGLLQAAITFGAIALVILILAGLLMLVFSLGASFDRRINNQ
jgi:hypothetical protein